jgi:hypothetical protein
MITNEKEFIIYMRREYPIIENIEEGATTVNVKEVVSEEVNNIIMTHESAKALADAINVVLKTNEEFSSRV